MVNRRSRTVGPVLVPLMLSLFLAGCTGADDDDPADGASTPTAPASVPMDAAVGHLTGRLKPTVRDAVVTEVAGAVDAWFEAAYLGEYPRTDFTAVWPGFSKGLALRARKDAALTSNAGIGAEVDAVRATVRKVRVDLLAVKGKPVGATARFRLVLGTEPTGAGEGDADAVGTSTVTGRLSLTPAGSGWQVFEYRVARNDQTKGGAQ